MRIVGNTIYADDGKQLRRVSDKASCGESYVLGYTYYLAGEALPEPHLEVPEDFEELPPEQIRQEAEEMYPTLVEQYIRERYTVSDELGLQRQRDTKPEAFEEYFTFCEQCKQRARNGLGL